MNKGNVNCFSCLLAGFLFFLAPAYSQTGGTTTTTSSGGIRIEKTNWTNSMGCSFDDDAPCIELLWDNTLVFKLIVRVFQPDISPYPEMHFFYFFPDYPNAPLTGVTDKVTNDMLEPVILENGAEAWQAWFTFEIDLSEECPPLPNPLPSSFPFNVEYQLVMPYQGTYLPYPTADYPDLFPSDTFNIHPSGYAEYYKSTKEICCAGESGPCNERIAIVSGSATDDPKGMISLPSPGPDHGVLSQTIANDPHLSPNPFHQDATVHYTVSKPGSIAINMFDLQGAAIRTWQFRHENTGAFQATLSTEAIPAGIYYLQIISPERRTLLKMVKM